MYLSIGGDMAVRDRTLIGIFDLDNTTCSRDTRAFLTAAEQGGQVVDVSGALPKSFVLTEEFGMEPRVSHAVQRRNSGKAHGTKGEHNSCLKNC